MITAPKVRISVREGPIVLQNAPNGASASFELWDDIRTWESFPAGALSAYYFIFLEKVVFDANQVRRVEDELINALLLLAQAWPFSGGAGILVNTVETVSSRRFESNAEDIERELLEAKGLRQVTHDAVLGTESGATYRHAPLAVAVDIAKFIRTDFHMYQLTRYYYLSSQNTRNEAWFVNLYKIRDLIHKIYHGENNARKALNISSGDWGYFGNMMNNNDLRHAEIVGAAPAVSGNDMTRCYGLAREWVAAQLRSKGLAAI